MSSQRYVVPKEIELELVLGRSEAGEHRVLIGIMTGLPQSHQGYPVAIPADKASEFGNLMIDASTRAYEAEAMLAMGVNPFDIEEVDA